MTFEHGCQFKKSAGPRQRKASQDRNEPSAQQAVDSLCRSCGICCDGTLFKDVELRAVDDLEKLRSLGLKVKISRNSGNKTSRSRESNSQSAKFTQPCAALENCLCRVYRDRPVHCREFECALLKAVIAGRIQESAALEIIRLVRRDADAVRNLMRKLGDSNSDASIGVRFRKLRGRIEAVPSSENTAMLYSRLTRAVHKLNLELGKHFYPGNTV